MGSKPGRKKKPVRSKDRTIYDGPFTRAEIDKVLASMFYPHLLVSREELKARKERAIALKARLKAKGKEKRPLSKRELTAFQGSVRRYLKSLVERKARNGKIHERDIAYFKKFLREFPEIYKSIRDEEKVKEYVKIILAETQKKK